MSRVVSLLLLTQITGTVFTPTNFYRNFILNLDKFFLIFSEALFMLLFKSVNRLAISNWIIIGKHVIIQFSFYLFKSKLDRPKVTSKIKNNKTQMKYKTM